MNLLQKSTLWSFALVAGMISTPLNSQERDVCLDYANEMISIDSRARQIKCVNWKNYGNFDFSYNWCIKQAPQRVNLAITNVRSRFQTCQFAASGSPAAQAQLRQQSRPQPQLGSAAFCKQHGSQMINLYFQLAQRRCSSSKLNFPIKPNITFEQVCLRRPAVESSALYAYWQPLVRNCRP